MRVRAASIGGRADVGPDGKEWVVIAEVPHG